jgi:hypothetical protein
MGAEDSPETLVTSYHTILRFVFKCSCVYTVYNKWQQFFLHNGTHQWGLLMLF